MSDNEHKPIGWYLAKAVRYRNTDYSTLTKALAENADLTFDWAKRTIDSGSYFITIDRSGKNGSHTAE